MKKAIVVFLLVVLAAGLGAGAFVWFRYDQASKEEIPARAIAVNGTDITPLQARWIVPVLGSALESHRDAEYSTSPASLGELAAAPPTLTLALPEGDIHTLTLTRGGEELFTGGPDQWDDALIAAPGNYLLRVHSETVPAGGEGYGCFDFAAAFTVPAPPEPAPDPPRSTEPAFEAGRLTLPQGDILALKLWNIPAGVQPAAETGLGLAVFTGGEGGSWEAAIPVGNARAPGEYPVAVAAGELHWEVVVTVLAYDFDEQDLSIDTTNPQIGEANSPAAYQEYRDTIPPLFYTWDEERYWEGLFLQPAQGRISTQFGEIRITNGDRANPSRHNGMDIAADEGDQVIAPNHGRVVLAEKLLNTGNTIVIEHGGGLKSYYFHLSELAVTAQDMVQKGDPLGKVGTTGYSTGPHLHYEMRIGDQPISPSLLFTADAGLYSLENIPNGTEEDTP